MRSLQLAKDESFRRRERLYILQAKDEAVHIADQHKLTKAVQTELLQRVNPEKTKGLSSCYLGALFAT